MSEDTGFCNIKTFMNKTNVKVGEMDLIGVIGFEVMSTGVDKMLNSLKNTKVINMRLDSLGGSVMDGLTIHNLLSSHGATVNIEIIGKAISMGSGIAMAGDHVSMHSAGVFMIHNPWAMKAGDSDSFRKTATALDSQKESLISLYADKSGISRNEISEMMDNETWFTPQEALDLGFIDEVLTRESSKAVAMSIPTGLNFQNIPDFAQDLIKTENKMSTETKENTPLPVNAGIEENKQTKPENENEIFQNLVSEQLTAMNVKLDSVITENTAVKAENKEIKEAKNLVDTELEVSKKETVEAKAEAEKAKAVTNKLGVNLSGVSDDLEPEVKELTPMETWKNMPRDTADERADRANYYHKEIKMKKGNK